MLSVQDAVKENLIDPVFIGDEKNEILSKRWCRRPFKKVGYFLKYEIINEPVENNTAHIWSIAAKLFFASDRKNKRL